METYHRQLILSLLILTGVLAAAAPGHAQFVLYDKFDGPLLDPSKWHGTSSEGNSNQPTEEFIRHIADGELRLILRSYGNNTSDENTVGSRQGLGVQQLGTPGGTGFITGVKARVNVLDVAAQDCATNVGAGPTRARANFTGSFFNDGTPGDANDHTGNIRAFLQLHQDGDGVKLIVGGILRCTSADCSSTETVAITGNPVTFVTAWAVNTPVAFRVNWLKDSHSFTFTVNPGTPGVELHTVDYTGIVTDTDPPRSSDFRTLQIVHSVKNCNGSRKLAFMDVVFDKVLLKRQP